MKLIDKTLMLCIIAVFSMTLAARAALFSDKSSATAETETETESMEET